MGLEWESFQCGILFIHNLGGLIYSIFPYTVHLFWEQILLSVVTIMLLSGPLSSKLESLFAILKGNRLMFGGMAMFWMRSRPSMQAFMAKAGRAATNPPRGVNTEQNQQQRGLILTLNYTGQLDRMSLDCRRKLESLIYTYHLHTYYLHNSLLNLFIITCISIM